MHLLAGLVFHCIILMVVLWDTGILLKSSPIITKKRAIFRLCIWISLALGFNYYIYITEGYTQALEFLTIYLIEGTLSLDNIFIFILLFDSFKVSSDDRHRVLIWGVLGAIIMRCLFIYYGNNINDQYSWINYLLGCMLVFSAFKMSRKSNHNNPAIFLIGNMLYKWNRITLEEHPGKFWIIQNKKLVFTSLFIVLISIERADLIFALDSIPAALAISKDPFIIYTANIFAVLGLRSLYFVISNIMHKFIYLKYALTFILGFIGIKIMVHQLIHIPAWFSLSLIGMAISTGIIFSCYKNKLR